MSPVGGLPSGRGDVQAISLALLHFMVSDMVLMYKRAPYRALSTKSLDFSAARQTHEQIS